MLKLSSCACVIMAMLSIQVVLCEEDTEDMYKRV